VFIVNFMFDATSAFIDMLTYLRWTMFVAHFIALLHCYHCFISSVYCQQAIRHGPSQYELQL